MLVCVQCQAKLADTEIECASCGWKKEVTDDVSVFLGAKDLADPVMGAYFENYDRIAADDLAEGILDEGYVSALADSLTSLLGPLDGLDVCDVGSGKGYLVEGSVRAGARSVVAVDVSMAYLRLLAQRPKVTACLANAENLPFVNSFDVITSTDVMEHVLNIGSYLYCVNRALRPGGRFVVRVPASENLLQYAPLLGCPYPFVHLRTFTPALLKSTLSQAGFKTVEIRQEGFSLAAPRGFWTLHPRLEWTYNKIRDRIRAAGHDDTSVNHWDHRLAGTLMRPAEVVAVAVKEREPVPGPNGNLTYRPASAATVGS